MSRRFLWREIERKFEIYSSMLHGRYGKIREDTFYTFGKAIPVFFIVYCRALLYTTEE